MNRARRVDTKRDVCQFLRQTQSEQKQEFFCKGRTTPTNGASVTDRLKLKVSYSNNVLFLLKDFRELRRTY